MFSITTIADLCSQESKALFVCGYHMAREEFLQQTAITDYEIVERESDVKLAAQKQVIFASTHKHDLFAKLVKTLPDTDDRIVFIKNVELFDDKVLNLTENISNLILTGDIDKCSFIQQILDRKWQSRVFFSQSTNLLNIKMPDMPKYSGYLKSQDDEGLVVIE